MPEFSSNTNFSIEGLRRFLSITDTGRMIIYEKRGDENIYDPTKFVELSDLKHFINLLLYIEENGEDFNEAYPE